MPWEQVVSLIALVIALATLVVGVLILRGIRARIARVGPLGAPADSRDRPSGPAAFVVNPIKTNSAALQTRARELAEELGLPEPLWFETTRADPGTGQARAALKAGASVVVAVGGDGTVRAVASVLAGTQVPVALLPMGTGNLLARNLDLPLDDTAALLRTALTGNDHPIDIGWVRTTDHDCPGAGEAERLFLVMAGVGFDAAMVAGAHDELKSKMGWLAYFLAGARHLHGRKLHLHLSVGEGEVHKLKARSLLLANCGRLPGGIVLLPDAELNDGWLDVAALDTRSSVLGWVSLFGKVVLQGVRVRKDVVASPSSIQFWRGREITATFDQPEHVQVDGDLIGLATSVTARVQQAGMQVRTR